MYLWRIDRLKYELATRRLSDRAVLPYLLGYLAMWVVCSELGRLVPAPIDGWGAATFALVVLSTLGGTYAVYRANGGASGREFLQRFLPLALVFGIRFTVATGAALVAMATWWTAIDARVAEARWLDAMLVGILAAVYYGRLAIHVRHVAEAAAGTKVHRSIAAAAPRLRAGT